MTGLQLPLFEEDDAAMTDAEPAAILIDVLAKHSDAAAGTGPLQAQPCVCEQPLVFAAELGEGRCGLCGREPRDR
jgi:hypothetical protein